MLAQPHRHIVTDRHRIEQRGKLEYVADVRAQLVQVATGKLRDFTAIHPHFASIRLEQSDDVLDRD